MKCAAAQRLISLQFDDRLSARDALRLRAHLNECAACSAFAHDLRRLAEASASLSETANAESFLLEVNRRIEAGPRRRMPVKCAPGALWFARLAGGVALTVCCAVFVMGMHFQRVRQAHSQKVAVEALQIAASQDIAMSFGEPFEDLAAANLASLGAETGGRSDSGE